MSAIRLMEIHEFEYVVDNYTALAPDFDLIGSAGSKQNLRKFVVVIEAEDGDRGEYVGQWGATSMALGQLVDLGPRLIGRNAFEREGIYDDFKRAHRQYDHMGFGYIDIALWDLAGKRYGASVSEMLGGFRKNLPAYASTTHGDSVHLATPKDYADFAERCYELGYRAFKIHGWSDGDVRREVAAVDALGERVGDRMSLLNDPASQLRTFLDALELGRACDRNGFTWLEDPFRDTGVSATAHRRLREKISTPLLVGEHLRGVEPKADLATSGATDLLRSDPEYDLGITGAMKIAHLGESLGMDVEIHASGPAHRACMSAMRNSNFYEVALVNPVAANPLPPVYADGYSDQLEAVDANGCFPVPTGPGLGVTYDWDWITAHTTNVHRFEKSAK
jgi:L-alanine-DL-glutamate epimerase-like enolase superfamily enzyme